MNQLSDALLKGRILALPTNIRLGRQYMQGTNTLAYYENPYITDKKRFYNIGPWSYLLHLGRLRNCCLLVNAGKGWPSKNTLAYFDSL
jgi:hypothetical protein